MTRIVYDNHRTESNGRFEMWCRRCCSDCVGDTNGRSNDACDILTDTPNGVLNCIERVTRGDG